MALLKKVKTFFKYLLSHLDKRNKILPLCKLFLALVNWIWFTKFLLLLHLHPLVSLRIVRLHCQPFSWKAPKTHLNHVHIQNIYTHLSTQSTLRACRTYSKPGLNPINKNLSSKKFSDKNLRFFNTQFFSENLINFHTKYFGAAGWTDF